MRIVVLVKHVPCAVSGLRFAQDYTLDRTAVRSQLNDVDACAIDQAVRIAVPRVGAQITAVTMGPAGAVEALQQALVLGADEGIHVLDDALRGSDALVTSLVLAAAVGRIGFDLVLCGSATTDSGMSVVPAMVAERLGVPALCFADAVRVRSEVEIRRDDGICAETLASALPALVSVTQRCGVARYPRFAERKRARHKLVRTWPLSRLGIGAAEVGSCGAATRVHTIRPAEGRKRVVVDCPPAEAAARLVDFLTAHDLV